MLLVLLILALTLLSFPSPAVRAAGLTCSIGATANGLTASFSGTISGTASTVTWTLSFGDDHIDSGSGFSVSDSHAYFSSGTYAVVLSASGNSFTGGPVSGSCSTTVTVRAFYSVVVHDGVKVSDLANYIHPLYVNDSANFSDSPTLVGPGGYGDTAKVTDNAAVTLQPRSSLLTPGALAAIGVVTLLAAGFALWKLVLPRLARG